MNTHYDDIDSRIDIEVALSKLSDRDLDILLDRYVSKMSYAKIARKHNLSTGYIPRLITKIKDNLQRNIEIK